MESLSRIQIYGERRKDVQGQATGAPGSNGQFVEINKYGKERLDWNDWVIIECVCGWMG